MTCLVKSFDGNQNELRSLVEKLDPYNWNTLCVESWLKASMATGRIKEIISSDKDNDVFICNSLICADDILQHYPILLVDSTLETLITDTKPRLDDLKLPYTGFFINNKFDISNNIVLMGIHIYNMSDLFSHYLVQTKKEMLSLKDELLEQGQDREFSQMISKIERYKDDNEKADKDTYKDTFICCFCITNESILHIITDFNDVRNRQKGLSSENFKLMEKATDFALNVSNLIVNHVDLGNPNNPKREVRIVPHYRDEESKRYKKNDRMSIIRVFGTLKNYTQQYNKEKRRYN